MYQPLLSGSNLNNGEKNISSLEEKSRNVCIPDHFQSEFTVNCSEFVYDLSEFKSTLTTELDLVCGKVNQRHFLGSVMMFGLMTGSLLGGPISK